MNDVSLHLGRLFFHFQTQRQIFERLLETDLTVSEIARHFEMSLSAISQHVNIFVRDGFIDQETCGRVKWRKLNLDHMREASMLDARIWKI